MGVVICIQTSNVEGLRRSIRIKSRCGFLVCPVWEGAVYNAEPVILFVEMRQMFCPCRESNCHFWVIIALHISFYLPALSPVCVN